MIANQDRVGVSDKDLIDGKLPMNNQPEFVSLADVADLVWRATRKKKDQANHFADLDQEGQGTFAGRTLMDLWFKVPASRTPQAWTAFYDAMPAEPPLKRVPDSHRGALPFRVAQIYEAMVSFVRAKDLPKFVCEVLEDLPWRRQRGPCHGGTDADHAETDRPAGSDRGL